MQFLAPVALGCLLYNQPEKAAQLYKYGKYKVTLGYCLSQHLYDPDSFAWWNLIDHNFYLGAVPLDILDHYKHLKNDLGITHVLSVVEDFELSIQSSQWQDGGITNQIVPVEDFHAVPLETIKSCVENLRQLLMSGKKVYIHCKGGRGRSATIVICYLLKYGLSDGTQFQSVQEVYDFVKSKRPVINLNPAQREAPNDYYTFLKNTGSPNAVVTPR